MAVAQRHLGELPSTSLQELWEEMGPTNSASSVLSFSACHLVALLWFFWSYKKLKQLSHSCLV